MRPEVGSYVKAVYDFDAKQQSGELSLKVGDVIKVTDAVDDNWLQGEAIYGAKGSFPSNFVEPLVLPDARMGQCIFLAVVDFPAEQNGDLELTKGDIILGTEQVDDNWWKGKNGPLRGIFPLSCVHELDVRTEGPRSRSASLRCRSASLKSRADSLAKTSEEMFARALVDVVPQIEGELGFQTGDLITVTEIVDDDWFYGQCHNNVGLVSTICVEFLNDFGDDEDVGAGHSVSESSGGRDLRAHLSRESIVEETSPSLSDFNQGRSTNLVTYTRENTRSHDAEITPYAKTLYPFQAQLPTELSFSDNEIVTLIQHIDEDWIEGELDGKIGLFPATFVEIIVDCPYAFEVSKPPHVERLGSVTGVTDNESVGKHEHPAVEDSQHSQLNETSGAQAGGRSSQNGHETGSQSTSRGRARSSEERVKTNHEHVGAVDSEPSLALVLHSFQGEVDGDLSVKEGDTIEVLRGVDSDWLEASDDQGNVGLVPKNHVQVISGAPQNALNKSSKAVSSVSVTGEASAASSHTSTGSLGEGPASAAQTSSVQSSISFTPSSSDKVSSSSVQSPQTSNDHASSSSVDSPQSSHDHVSSGSVDTPQSSHDQSSDHRQYNGASSKPVPAKPAPLPKPKLAPKPVIKPKPSLAPKPVLPAQGSSKASSTGHSGTPVDKPASRTVDSLGKGDSKDHKVFSGVNVGLSLDNLVKSELEKAKSSGNRSSGGSLTDDDKQSQSGSISSSISDLPPANSVNSQRNSQELPGSQLPQTHVKASQGVSLEVGQAAVNSEHEISSVKDSATDSLQVPSQKSSRSLSNPDMETMVPPCIPLSRSTSDSGFTAVSKGEEASPASKASHRYSMPPARPVPPVPRPADKGAFVNAGFEHENEGQLISLDAMESSKPPPPNRTLPRPPATAVSPDLLGDDGEKRIKRPPPRPLGPRVASVPSRTPLLPIRADSSKPIPHRPAPVAPGGRPAPMVAKPMPAAVTAAEHVPPRPVSPAGVTPPKRPPPRLQRSPNDLMRFSPEPVIDEVEDNAELVADLKKRLQENRNDIQKYEQSKQELEEKLAVMAQEEEEDGESQRVETEESLQWVIETLQGLREEEDRLKGNLFSVSPREEKLEKARLLAEQRATDKRLRKEEEEKNAAEERAKRREKRQKVLQELVDTEKDYLFDLQLCLSTFFDSDSAIKVPASVDIDYLFGNMEEIADVSQRLLTSLESAISGKAFQDQIIGSTFVALAEAMKNTYAPYCRHHDDVIAIMEKYREIPEACQYFAAKVEEMRRRTNIFDVEAMLIKPVQRILKYPLLLHELLKSTEDDHPDKAAITNAIRAMTDVATAINEYKRRKDLVFKYKRDSDQSFAMKIAKLNFHSIKKKSSRMRGRLSTNLGIGLQLRDEKFEQEETRFRSAEKAVKVLLRNVMTFMDQMQEVISCQENLAADISDYFGEKTCEEVTRYLTVHRELLSHYKTLTGTVEELVICPLNKLVGMLNGPNNVIDKRFDKLLDYNNLLGRGKDEKLVQAAKNDYEAMNAQLLDELPQLYQLTMTLLQHCMAAYVRAQRDFQDQALKENCILLEAVQQLQKLPSVLGGSENVMENFNIRHTAALDHISMLSFIPRGFNPKMDAFRLDRRGSSRQSFDTTKPPPTVQSTTQSDSQRMYLRQMYGADNLYQVTQTMPAHDLMDMAVTVGTLVAVIKDKDPMGGRQRWFVDDGANKGFVQSSILTKPSSSPTGSLSSLTADDSDDVAASLDEGDALPWLATQSASPYPDMTDVSQTDGSSSSLLSSSSGQPPFEYYTAEYPFQARSDNEVTLFMGQVVVVLSHQDLDGNTEWWLVDADGYQGYAPANYLRKM